MGDDVDDVIPACVPGDVDDPMATARALDSQLVEHWQERARIAEQKYAALRDDAALARAESATRERQLRAEMDVVRCTLADAQLVEDDARRRVEYLVREIRRALGQAERGPTRQARDILAQACVRVGEQVPPTTLGTDQCGTIPVAGRGLKAGRVGLTPTAGGLVIRVDDDDDPAVWVEMVLRETVLLRQLASVHRLAHGPGAETRAGG